MRPETASDPATAWALASQAAEQGRGYHLFVVDALTPGFDAFAFSQRLRRERAIAAPILLVLSAALRRSQAQRCQELGLHCMESPVSQSSLFNVVVEALGLQPKPVSPVAAEVLDETPPRRLRVLLAEDTRANQILVAFALQKRGHSLEVVQNGQQALEAVNQGDFDVVLMDVQMPVMDGIDATRAIRQLADPRKARVPIIAMTAQAFQGDADRCLAAGMNNYLSKPVVLRHMIEMVENVSASTAFAPAGSSPPEKVR